jgi:hypothetical protein
MRITFKTLAQLSAMTLATAIFAQTVSAQEVEKPGEGAGTTAYADAPQLDATAALAVKPTLVFPSSSYTTGGVSLRNRGAGNINVSGLVGPAKVTFIYWTVINNGVPPAPAAKIEIHRLFPVLPAVGPVVLPGVVVGVGPAPCWGPAGNTIITVYRAAVPPAIATGNGSYQVTLLPGAQAVTNGASPWKAFGLPSWDGASMVMIGKGVNTVSIYDNGLAGHTFSPIPAFNYTINLPLATVGVVLLDNIGSDGKHSNLGSREANMTIGDESTMINGFPVAGPGSAYWDSDWNGSAGLPVTELWDDTGHDITATAPPGTIALNVSIFAPGPLPADCLTPVANVVQQ